MINSKNPSHAYLFVGLGLMPKALEIARKIQGKTRFDTHIVKPEQNKQISIEQIRELQHTLSLYSHSAPYKIAIIDQAEKMTREAGNALLKTLEEPKGKTVVILLTNSVRSILPTIISRCQLVKFPLTNIEEVKKQIEGFKDFEKDLDKLIDSDLAERFRYVELIAKDKGKIPNMLNCWLIKFREFLIKGKHSSGDSPSAKTKYRQVQLLKIIKKIQKTIYLITKTNTNPRLALEVLVWQI